MEKRKLNILFITNEYPINLKNKIFSYGGQASYVENITNLLTKKSINISIWVLSERNRIYRKKKIFIREIGYNLRFFGKYKSFLNSLIISIHIFFLNKSKFDIIQYPSFFPLGFFIFFPKKKVLKICRLSGVTKFWRKINSKKINLFHKISDKIEKNRILKADKVFAPSKKISKMATRYYKRKIDLCRSPIINFEKKFLLKKKIQKNFFLFVGTLNKSKGIDLLCKAMIKVFSQNKKINLVLIGRNDKINGNNSLDYIYKKSKKYKSRIFYIGKLNKTSIYYYYKKALAVIIPSRIDNAPNVMLEALAFKKIIIAFKNSSIDEIIINKINGLIAKKKNFVKLQNSINYFLKLNKKQKKIMKKNIFKLVKKLKERDYAQEHLDYYGVF